jgi:hypothetical protein
MASKKLKKAIMAGIVGAVGAKALGQAKEMKTYLAEEGGDKAKRNYITKKAKPTQKFSFSADKFKKAVKTIKDKGLDLGPGVNATSKKGGTLAGDYGNAFGDGFSGGAKAGKMIKARGGKMVNLKPTKLY